MTLDSDLEELILRFRSKVEFARDLETPNAEDDLVVRTAICGFAYAAPNTEWNRAHYDVLKSQVIEQGYFEERIRRIGASGNHKNLLYAFALAAGYLIGMLHSKAIGDQEFERGLLMTTFWIETHISTILA